MKAAVHFAWQPPVPQSFWLNLSAEEFACQGACQHVSHLYVAPISPRHIVGHPTVGAQDLLMAICSLELTDASSVQPTRLQLTWPER